jgi:tRNA(Ile)-lysidine synthase
MPRHRGAYRRPLLALDRATTAAACAEAGLQPWDDPHNGDPAYARARARTLLAELEGRLGPGVRRGLARSASLLRADDDALSAWAAREYAGGADSDEGLDCGWLAALPTAVRSRVIVLACRAAGVRAADLGEVHVAALDALVTDWHGQGPVDLPGPVSGRRDCGRLLLARPTTPEQPQQPEE